METSDRYQEKLDLNAVYKARPCSQWVPKGSPHTVSPKFKRSGREPLETEGTLG